MSQIRSKGNTSTELRLLAILRASGITGWRRHLRLPGNPDFAFPKHKVAVFVDGCFWHGCRYHGHVPKSRQSYWDPKIRRNALRHKTVQKLLRLRNWSVLRVWEHSLEKPSRTISRIRAVLANRHVTR